MKEKYAIISIVIIFFVATFITLIFLNEDSSVYGKLYISELSATNFSIIKDEDNDYSDYIEIYNGYNFDVNLKGYHLSDKEYNTSKWEFPDVTIKSGEYLIVFADGKDKNDVYLHTNFKLKEEGEVVVFTDSDGVVLSKMKYEKTSYNTSYGFNGIKAVYYYKPTPGGKNEGKYSINPIVIKDDDSVSLKITEYITENTVVYDSDGDYSPMVEIYNYGKSDVNLNGYFISDKESKLTRYSISDVSIKSGEYLVIYLSGKNKYEKGEIHTNFKIKEEEVIVLSSPYGKIIDKVNVINLPINTSYGINDDDTWCYYPTPTFGKKNDTKCFSKIGGDINGTT